MDSLTVFGALAVTAMLVFYALEPRSPVFVLAFALACLASSAYGFLQGRRWAFGHGGASPDGPGCSAGAACPERPVQVVPGAARAHLDHVAAAAAVRRRNRQRLAEVPHPPVVRIQVVGVDVGQQAEALVGGHGRVVGSPTYVAARISSGWASQISRRDSRPPWNSRSSARLASV